MAVEDNELDDLRLTYIRIWERLFFEFLGWDNARVIEWANGWSLLKEPNLMFFHESPIYYAAPQLIPEDLRSSLSRTERDTLLRRIEAIIDQPALFTALDTYDWSAARNRVGELLQDPNNLGHP
jgi:hypothetical protein